MRPPSRGSRMIWASARPDTVWSAGHQVSIRAVQVRNECSGGQSTSNSMVSGSVIADCFGVLGDESKSGARLAPDLLEVALDGQYALGLK